MFIMTSSDDSSSVWHKNITHVHAVELLIWPLPEKLAISFQIEKENFTRNLFLNIFPKILAILLRTQCASNLITWHSHLAIKYLSIISNHHYISAISEQRPLCSKRYHATIRLVGLIDDDWSTNFWLTDSEEKENWYNYDAAVHLLLHRFHQICP